MEKKIPSKSQGSGGKQREGAAVRPAQVIELVVHAAAQVRVLHWAARRMPAHKALDDLHDSIHELGDRLVEGVLGKAPEGSAGAQRALAAERQLAPLGQLHTDAADVDSHLASLAGRFEALAAHLRAGGHLELDNIVQELLAAVAKARYVAALE